MEDQSRLARFHTGDLVVYGGCVYIVDHNSGKESCYIRRFEVLFPVPERFLRKLTRLEYAWYQDPVTGGMKVGRTPATEWLIQFIASLLLIVGGWLIIDSWEGWFGIGRGLLLFIGSARIIAMVYGFLRNYSGKQA